MRRQTLALSAAWATLATFPATAQTAPSATSPAANGTPRAAEEITVTATRRSENVLKIPYNITALSGATLANRGVTDLASLRNQVPGLTAADYGNRAANVNNDFIIRGINTDSIGIGVSEFPNLGAPAVSNYIDETPLFVNLKLSDIQRVEVLRGPQGTLFGADSVGGTIRTLHNKPDPSKLSYALDATVSGTDHADQPNSATNVTLNVPITSRMALRVNAGYERDAGYITGDNTTRYTRPGGFLPFQATPVLANQADPIGSPAATDTAHGINSSNVWYARGDLLYRITDDFTAEASYQHQDDRALGFSYEFPGANYVTHRRIADAPSVTKTDLAALTLTEDFGFATLISSSSYYNVDTRDQYDLSGLDVAFPGYYGAFPRITTPNYDFNRDRAFTQEVRLVSPKGRYFDYVVGVYYQNRRQDVFSINTVPGFANWANLPGTGPDGYASWADYVVNYFGGTRPGHLAIRDETYDFKRDVQLTDLAGFADATAHLTPRWNLEGGVRVFRENFRQSQIQHFYTGGLFFGSDTAGTSTGSGSKLSVDKIFKVNTSYNITPDTLGYLTFSQGYRSAGANAFPVGTCLFCNSANLIPYNADTANNYEVGLKGKIGRLRYSTAGYWIAWNNIQQEVASNAGTPVVINGKTARSRGLELEGSWLATDTVTLGGGYAYTDATLTKGFSIVDNGRAFASANSGALLPGVSKHQINGSFDYAPDLLAGRPIDLHLDGSWHSGLNNQIQATPIDFRHISGFALFNASAQIEVAPRTTLKLFVHNLFNAKGVTAVTYRASAASPQASAASLLFDPVEIVSRPLTVGLTLTIRG